jgi:hypothetical protein
MPSLQEPVDASFSEQMRKSYDCFLSTITGARYLESDAGKLMEVDS